MSKATLEVIAKLHAKLSDAYESLAAEADEAKPKAGKTKVADPDELEEPELPAPKRAGTTGKAKPAAKTSKKVVEPEEEEITEQDLVNAATKLIKATDRATAVKIIKKHGGDKIADLDEDVYPKVLAALEAAMPSEEEPEEEEI